MNLLNKVSILQTVWTLCIPKYELFNSSRKTKICKLKFWTKNKVSLLNFKHSIWKFGLGRWKVSPDSLKSAISQFFAAHSKHQFSSLLSKYLNVHENEVNYTTRSAWGRSNYSLEYYYNNVLSSFISIFMNPLKSNSKWFRRWIEFEIWDVWISPFYSHNKTQWWNFDTYCALI